MYDTIELNLRALDEETIYKLKNLVDEQLNLVPDETNEKALETIDTYVSLEY